MFGTKFGGRLLDTLSTSPPPHPTPNIHRFFFLLAITIDPREIEYNTLKNLG